MRIDFIENKYGHFAVSARYLLMSFKHLGLGVWGIARLFHEKVVKRYPLAIILAVILSSIVSCTVQIGKARAERDSISRELYVTQQKLDRLNVR